MRLSLLFALFLVGCAGSKPAPSIDREPAPRATEALPSDATHKTETAPKRETTPTPDGHLDKSAPKAVANEPAPEAKPAPAKAEKKAPAKKAAAKPKAAVAKSAKA